MPASLAIILDGKRILLVKRRDLPVWVIPGGGIEPGESPEKAAQREAVEETGFEVEITHKLGLFTKANWLTDDTHVFVTRIIKGVATLGPESRAIEWFDRKTLPTLLPPPHLRWLELALKKKHDLHEPVPDSSHRLFLWAFIHHPIVIGRFLLTKIGIRWNT